MTDIPIPPEAFTAAELAYTDALAHNEDPLRAACLAMLKAWPGMAYRYRMSVSLEPQEIILPITENSGE